MYLCLKGVFINYCIQQMYVCVFSVDRESGGRETVPEQERPVQ